MSTRTAAVAAPARVPCPRGGTTDARVTLTGPCTGAWTLGADAHPTWTLSVSGVR